MGLNLRDLVASYTGGIVGSGKAPDVSQYSSGDIADNEKDWSPADSMKAAASALSVGDDNGPGIEADDKDSKGTIGGTLMGLRNGGLREGAANYLSNGIQGNGWSL